MANPADDFTERVSEVQKTKDFKDQEVALEFFKMYRRGLRSPAQIKRQGAYGDEFIVDVYENGYYKANLTDNEPTRQDLTAYATLVLETIAAGTPGRKIEIMILPSGMCLILPLYVPYPQQGHKGYALMVLDNAGSIGWEPLGFT
jgi:hypothetical protein